MSDPGRRAHAAVERAAAHFEAALALDRRMGASTWVAHGAFEYARLLERSQRADPGRAAELLGEATGLAERIGMKSLLAKAAALGVTPKPALPDGLSPREAEILELVAGGLSNREIGAALYISEHTAANHIRNILRKTESANRTEAASYATGTGSPEAHDDAALGFAACRCS